MLYIQVLNLAPNLQESIILQEGEDRFITKAHPENEKKLEGKKWAPSL